VSKLLEDRTVQSFWMLISPPPRIEPRWFPSDHVYYSRCDHPASESHLSNEQLLASTGDKDLEEIELTHLEGHKHSRPVRIGNGAADHVQLVCVSYAVNRAVLMASLLLGYLRRTVRIRIWSSSLIHVSNYFKYCLRTTLLGWIAFTWGKSTAEPWDMTDGCRSAICK
jgi:hypothetical protein